MDRRTFLGSVAVGATGLTTGCVEEVLDSGGDEPSGGDSGGGEPSNNEPVGSGGITEPDPEPRVADTDNRANLDGSYYVRALVVNRGGEGPVVVEVEIRRGSTVTNRVRKTIQMRRDEQRQVDFESVDPQGGERFRVLAEAR